MNYFAFTACALTWLVIGLGLWLGWQLLRQNGRILLRLEGLEKRLDEFESAEHEDEAATELHSLVTSAATNGEGERANRFGNRSLARSKLKRDGLKAGTVAPNFRLPRLDGHGDLSLEELRGQRVLLVFSDP